MTYEVRLTATAQRSFDRLPEKAAFAVAEFLVGPLAVDPQRVGKLLRDPYKGVWSARVGVYRVLYEIDDVVCVVEVIRIGHRADVYRR